jgi:hypothetical protein
MEMTTEAGETEAVKALLAATPLSLMAEALAEGVGLVDLAAKTNRRALERLGAPAMSQASLPAVC